MERIIHEIDEADIRENINKLKGITEEERKKRYLFATRLNKLLIDREMTQTKLSDETNISTGAISNYRNGIKQPTVYSLYIIAKVLGVSTDYLSGMSEFESSKEDYKVVNKTTGLSTKAIDTLFFHKNTLNGKLLIPTINYLLELENQENENLPTVLSSIENYLEYREKKDRTLYVDRRGLSTKPYLVEDECGNKKELAIKTIDDKFILDTVFLEEIKELLKEARKDYSSKNRKIAF